MLAPQYKFTTSTSLHATRVDAREDLRGINTDAASRAVLTWKADPRHETPLLSDSSGSGGPGCGRMVRARDRRLHPPHHPATQLVVVRRPHYGPSVAASAAASLHRRAAPDWLRRLLTLHGPGGTSQRLPRGVPGLPRGVRRSVPRGVPWRLSLCLSSTTTSWGRRLAGVEWDQIGKREKREFRHSSQILFVVFFKNICLLEFITEEEQKLHDTTQILRYHKK